MTEYPASESEYRMTMTTSDNMLKRWSGRLLPWLLIVLYVAAVQWLIGWDRVFSAWSQMSAEVLAVAVALMIVSYLLRAWRITSYFGLSGRGDFPGAVAVTLQHNLFNHLLPARSGEISFPLLLKRRFQLDWMHSTAALFWLRLLDLHFVLGLALFLAAQRLGGNVMASVAFGAWLVAPLLLAPPLIGGLSRRREGKPAKGRFGRLLDRFLAGLPDSRERTGRSLLITWLNWIVKLGLVAWLFRSFSGATWPASLAGMLGGEITSVLPFHSPGGVGTYEAGVMLAAAPYHLPARVVASAGVNVHLFLLGMALASGGAALLLTQGSVFKTEVA